MKLLLLCGRNGPRVMDSLENGDEGTRGVVRIINRKQKRI